MKTAKHTDHWLRTATLVAGAMLLVGTSTGCQVSVNGQTLPSPNYLEDDVQYFPGVTHKLEREEAALRAAKAEERLQGG